MSKPCFWKECKREFKKVRDERSPGYILKGFRYIFAALYLLGASKWITGTCKADRMRRQGNFRRYCYIDIYVTAWVIIEVAIAFACTYQLPLILRESIVSCVIIGILSYRLFDIFQSWVSQFILKSKWEAIDVNRSLVLAFVAYVEITIIGAIVSFICHPCGNFCNALYNSVMNMIANPRGSDGSAIRYAQIMFAILFVAVVAQHIVGRIISTKQR